MESVDGGSMSTAFFARTAAQIPAQSSFKVDHKILTFETTHTLEFIDITDEVIAFINSTCIQHGFINIQTKHTTTAIMVNEHEPLLLGDIAALLERCAPQTDLYAHNDFAIRTVNLTPDEKANGHAHCKAALMSASTTINIFNGELQLGRWQRIFFVELDSARHREISLMVMGLSEEN